MLVMSEWEHPDMEHEGIPDTSSGLIAIVWRQDGKRDMVTLRDGKAYLWRYKDTDDEFCKASDIVKWRYAGGFDF